MEDYIEYPLQWDSVYKIYLEITEITKNCDRVVINAFEQYLSFDKDTIHYNVDRKYRNIGVFNEYKYVEKDGEQFIEQNRYELIPLSVDINMNDFYITKKTITSLSSILKVNNYPYEIPIKMALNLYNKTEEFI